MEIQLTQRYLRREMEKQKSATTNEAPGPSAADDEPVILKEQAPPASEDNKTTTAQEEPNAFDLPDDHQGFDNDLDALLDSVGQQQPGQSADDMGGLFGDDFDFIIPDQ